MVSNRVFSMELSYEEVRRIAELAKLEVSSAEAVLYADQLSHILQYFERLQEVDTSQIAPTASVLPLKNILRADKAASPLPLEQVLANASDAHENQFRVSAVLGDA
jgi:aspartyl-tRNA(Asn)/glutamyl-tRNA(Gln) amidotransferase subunit C